MYIFVRMWNVLTILLIDYPITENKKMKYKLSGFLVVFNQTYFDAFE